MLLSDDRVSVFFDGALHDPQLDHPEGVAIHPDGSVWCGGERGQIFRLDPDGGSIEQVASTDGFCLGMAFDRSGEHLFVCDQRHAAVFRLDVGTGRVERFADGAVDRPFLDPNFPALDAEGRVYVSDSHTFPASPGPGVFRDRAGRPGELWYDRDVVFANGLAVAPDGSALYVAETFAANVFRIRSSRTDRRAIARVVAHVPGSLPDGLAFDVEGNLYVGCYEPSHVLRIDPSRAGRGALARRDGAHTRPPDEHRVPRHDDVHGEPRTVARDEDEVGIEGVRLPAGSGA